MCRVVSCRIVSYHIISYIISYRIASHRIASHPIVSYRIISYIISYRIVSYRIVSYNITSYIILYYIITYHIIQLYSFLTATLEGGEWSAAGPGRTLPPGKTRYTFYRRLDGSQGRSGLVECLVPTGIRSRTVQLLVSHYTD